MTWVAQPEWYATAFREVKVESLPGMDMCSAARDAITLANLLGTRVTLVHCGIDVVVEPGDYPSTVGSRWSIAKAHQ